MNEKRLLIPAVVIVAIVTQVPFIVTIVLSLLKWNVQRPDMGIEFTGLNHFAALLGDAGFYQVVLNTLLITAIALAICTALGLGLAFLFNRDFRGISILRALILLPYFVTGSVIGIIWKTLLLDPSFGLNAKFAKLLGIAPIDFLGSFPILTIIILVVWQQTPFFYLILRAGLQNLSESVVESAKIDGAAGWNMLFKIKIPAIKGHFMVAVMFGLINISKVFDLIYVTTSGGPGIASSNLSFYSYRSAFYDWDMGQAATIAVVSVVIILVAVQNFSKAMSRNLDPGADEYDR